MSDKVYIVCTGEKGTEYAIVSVHNNMQAALNAANNVPCYFEDGWTKTEIKNCPQTIAYWSCGCDFLSIEEFEIQ